MASSRPGAEKLEIARRLEALRVDVIEAGFACTSPGDFEAVRAIAGMVRGCGVASLSRALKGDIDASWEALNGAVRPRIHIVLPTSAIHMEYKVRMTPDEVLRKARESVAYARTLCADVEFSAEDAGRSDREFLAAVYGAVIEAGATVVNVPDTVGYLSPGEMYGLIAYLKTGVPGIDGVDISVHCHNDLGMAVANSLAAVEAGAAQVECTLNGIGERAGNASLEELAMALKTRQDRYNAAVNIETRLLYRTCGVLSRIVGFTPAPNKPIIGANAFAHESGIHQHGVLTHRGTYEIMRPEDIGIPSNTMVLGKHSGRHGFEDRLSDLGFALTRAEIDEVFEKFKRLADLKQSVTDDDIAALVGDKSLEVSGGYVLERFVVSSGNTIPAMASVKLTRDGAVTEEASTFGYGRRGRAGRSHRQAPARPGNYPPTSSKPASRRI
jgi:2-isopropylmalate synthase